jgi:hypothetical protein
MRRYKNIRLLKSPLIEDRIVLINRVIRECLLESFNSVIETKFELINEGDIVIYRFITNNNNSYDLEFIPTVINLNKLTKSIKKQKLIPSIDIAFVPSEVNLNDRNNEELYNKETNRGEHIELIGRISYLIKEFIKDNPLIKIYVVGKDTKTTKLKIYLSLFDNIFSGDYIKIESENDNYNNGAYYFIKHENTNRYSK